jgi:hypothetical protein
MYSKENIPPAFYIQGVEGSQDMTTATDPATNAATTAAIVNSFAGVIITTTTTGNSQTLASPTATTAAGQIFTVVNNDTSTDNVPVVANSVTFTVTPGESQSFIWDGTAWGPVDLGLTSLPVPYNQGGTGVTNDLANYHIWVDGARTDTYTADGSMARPYKTVLAALTAINADVGKSWVMKVATGTYSDNLTITGPRYLRIEAQGAVTLSGTILINSGVGAYDRIEFVGQVEGPRAEKGPGLTISNAITAVRTDDSLIYVGFHGCLVSGAFSTTTNGTWVVQYRNCRVNGAITGTFSAFTGTAPNQSSILIESYGFNEFVGTISGITSFYNCNGSDFYCTINTAPEFLNKFVNCTFAGSVSIIPQAGADSTLIYVDAPSYKSLFARTPTITGATYSALSNLLPAETLNIGDGYDVTITAEDVASSITLDEQTFEVEGEGTATRLMKLKNDTDAAVTVTVGGDQDISTNGVPTFGGATFGASSTVTMGDSSIQIWDVTPAANGGFSGQQESVTAGATVALYDVLYEGADGEWYHADADASATMPALRMAVGAGVDGGAVNTITRGVVRFDTWTWTIGMPIYVSTEGASRNNTTTFTITQTAPSGELDVIQIVGYALSATVMYFDPSPILTEVGLDYVDEGTATPTTITMAELSAVPKVFMADHSSNQTFNLAAITASDVGKQFWIVKDGTGAGTVILDMPADTYVDDSASGGTIYCAASTRASALFMITSTTTVQTLCATGTWTTT